MAAQSVRVRDRGPRGLRGPVPVPQIDGPVVQWPSPDGTYNDPALRQNLLGPEGPAGNTTNLNSRAHLNASVIANGIERVRLAGFAAANDDGEQVMEYIGTVAPSPVKIWHAHSNGGTKWWRLKPYAGQIYGPQLGCFGNGVACDLQAAFDAVLALNPVGGGALLLAPGTTMAQAGIVHRAGVTVRSVAGKGMYAAGYDPRPNMHASWIEMPAAFNGRAMSFHTKSPVHLEHFGLKLDFASTTAHGIYIDNHAVAAEDDDYSYIANFGSTIRGVSVIGGAIQVHLLNCASYSIGGNSYLFFGWLHGVVLQNDGSGDPYPFVDSGDGRIRDLNIQMDPGAAAVGGTACIALKTQGGVDIGSGVKLLGGQVSISYDCSVAGMTGENNIHDINAEACSVAGFRTTRSHVDGLTGGLNIIDSHFSVGTTTLGAPHSQAVLAFTAPVSGNNYLVRGKIHGNDLSYSNSDAGTAAIVMNCGDQIEISNNIGQQPPTTFLIADGLAATDLSGNPGRIDVRWNGPINGAATMFGALNAGVKVLDNNGIAFANVPPVCAKGSMIFVTDGLWGSNPLTAGGDGAWAHRVGTSPLRWRG